MPLKLSVAEHRRRHSEALKDPCSPEARAAAINREFWYHPKEENSGYLGKILGGKRPKESDYLNLRDCYEGLEDEEIYQRADEINELELYYLRLSLEEAIEKEENRIRNTNYYSAPEVVADSRKIDSLISQRNKVVAEIEEKYKKKLKDEVK